MTITQDQAQKAIKKLQRSDNVVHKHFAKRLKLLIHNQESIDLNMFLTPSGIACISQALTQADQPTADEATS